MLTEGVIMVLCHFFLLAQFYNSINISYFIALFCRIFQLHFPLCQVRYHLIFSFSSVNEIVQMQDGVRRRRSAEPRGRTEGWQVLVSCKPSLIIFIMGPLQLHCVLKITIYVIVLICITNLIYVIIKIRSISYLMVKILIHVIILICTIPNPAQG